MRFYRSSCPEVFCKKGVLRNFAKFTGKHLCQNLFFNKVAGLRPATLLKNSLWHKYFSVNFPKFLRTPFLTKHLRWLLLRGSIMDSLLESFLIVESCINNQYLNVSIKEGDETCISVSPSVINGWNMADPDIRSSNPGGAFRNASLIFISPSTIKPYNSDGCFGSLSN